MTRFGPVLLLAACAAGRPARTPPPNDLEFPTQPHASAIEQPEAGATQPGVTPPPAPAVISTPAPPPTVTAPAPADPATLERLAWPASTASFVLRSSAHVYASPDLTSEPLGKIVVSTRLPVGASIVGDKQCKIWLAVTPKGLDLRTLRGAELEAARGRCSTGAPRREAPPARLLRPQEGREALRDRG
ncbi:MAG: hypothetical protein IPQ07_23635 [Myxococcales bacterium]|nr:hypothetical protein [Myxococcales bacterium]